MTLKLRKQHVFMLAMIPCVMVAVWLYGNMTQLIKDSTFLDEHQDVTCYQSSPVPSEDSYNASFEKYHGLFQPVEEGTEVFVYSAIFDIRATNTCVRILTIVPVPRPKDMNFKCVLKWKSSKQEEVIGQFEDIPPSNWGVERYRYGWIVCPVLTSNRPTSVSVGLLTNRTSSNITNLIINYPDNSNIKSNLTRCLPALFGNITVANFVTSVETNLYFGTDRFIIYLYNASKEIKKVLEYYERKGIFEVRNWSLPVPVNKIHYYGQMAAIHDCLYSQMGKSKYIFFGDIDEVVVPHNQTSVFHLANRIFEENPNKYGALYFRNAFFFTYGDKTKSNFCGKSDALKYEMDFFTYTNRTGINPAPYKTKVLVIPEKITNMHIHMVDMFLPSCSCNYKVVDTADAIMHHYRSSNDPYVAKGYFDDTSLLHHTSQLIPRIKHKLDFPLKHVTLR